MILSPLKGVEDRDELTSEPQKASLLNLLAYHRDLGS